MASVPRLRGVRLGSVLLLVTVALAAAPATSAAAGERTQHRDVTIEGDAGFTKANGIRSGSGTAADPYVISGWDIWSVRISDTSKHVVIRDNVIRGQLILNWNGPGVTVVNNEIADLRVNQNVKRTGAATGGVIARNTFGVVGQLRHFDGRFEDNVVLGRRDMLAPLFGGQRAVQFDGFNGAVFRNNEIYGYVDAKLHGHHHGSGFSESSHYHGAHVDHDAMDHTVRYHEVLISGNEIHSTARRALRYTDAPHSVDDRTAASETNEELNEPHVHFTRVHLIDNRLVGAGLHVDVFNAADDRHIRTERGTVRIEGNTISLVDDTKSPWDESEGITIERARDVTLKVIGNRIEGEMTGDRDLLETHFVNAAGVALFDLTDADVLIRDNVVSDLVWGVRAARLSKSVSWWIDGLRTERVDQDVYYDSSVENEPRRTP